MPPAARRGEHGSSDRLWRDGLERGTPLRSGGPPGQKGTAFSSLPIFDVGRKRAGESLETDMILG